MRTYRPYIRNVPFVRFQTPPRPIFIARFSYQRADSQRHYVNGGLETPTSTKFEIGELVYLAGSGYQTGNSIRSFAKSAM